MATATKTNPGYFNILYFASASSYTLKTSELVPAPLPLSQLFRTLEERYGGFRSKVLDSCLVTINLEYVDMPEDATESEVIIAEGDEVAIIPPVSSG